MVGKKNSLKKSPKKSRNPARAKSASKRPAPKPKKKTSKRAAKRPAQPKTVARSKLVAKKAPPARAASSKSFADRVRDCEPGTPVWFTVAGGIEHAVIRARAHDGAVAILTDAAAARVVAGWNLFETAAEAKAARSR